MRELLILYGFMALVVACCLGAYALIAFTCTVPVLTATSIVWLTIAGFIEFMRLLWGFLPSG